MTSPRVFGNNSIFVYNEFGTPNSLIPDRPKGIISDELQDAMEYAVDVWICSILCYVGIIDNIVAMVVFAKMGFHNTINISLTSIAFWDLIKCLCGAIIRAYGVIRLSSLADAQSWKNMSNVMFGYLYIIASYVSGVLASYVALERCLCVSLPFTVKFLLTKKLVTFLNVILPVIVFGLHAITFWSITYKFVYSEKFNKTIAVISKTTTFYEYPIIDPYTTMMSIFTSAFFVVEMSVCTLIISYCLRKTSKVRRGKNNSNDTRGTSETSGDGSNKSTTKLSSRDRHVIKMLLIVVVMYIVTYIPQTVMYITTHYLPGFRLRGVYNNLKWLTLYFMFMFDYINAMVNPIIFFFMSSTFKETFLTTFRLRKK